jgi:transcriptional regulator with AAA-type ATPase domain/methylase of polypeptide subunit release factors
MIEADKLNRHEENILRVLDHCGTSLGNVELERSLLFLLSTVIVGGAFAVVWRREGGAYVRSFTTITPEDYRKQQIAIGQAFHSANLGNINRLPDKITVSPNTRLPLQGKIREMQLRTRFGAVLVANHVILLSLGNREILLELYCKADAQDVERNLSSIDRAAQSIYQRLNSRLAQVYKVLSGEDQVPLDFREIDGEGRLFRYIFRDVKTWFGEDFRTVNIFKFDPLDRMLYHLETSHLTLDEEALKQYEPTPEISKAKIYDYIKENIHRTSWPDSINPDLLEQTLYDLRHRTKWKAQGLKDDAKILKALLTVMPQEPGTGVAGETVLTRIPQLGQESDPRWEPQNANYRDKFFASMLSVEQLFGIGSSGNRMAAVPLMESGQLWGVLFFVQHKAYDEERLLELWERAQHLSSVLTLFRSFQFQDSITRGAKRESKKSMATLALENIHFAVNPVFAVHWQLHGSQGGQNRVEYWQFSEESNPGRFGYSGVEEGTAGVFRSYSLRNRVLERIQKGEIEVVQNSYDIDEGEFGIPKKLKIARAAQIRSALMIPVPGKVGNELLAVYTSEDADILRRYVPQFQDRFSCLWDIQSIREPETPTHEIITQSKKIEHLLRRSLQIVQNPSAKSILILGENGTGKDLLAKRLHRLSGRRGERISIQISALPKETIESELFGSLPGAFTGAGAKPKLGFFALADQGTLTLDEVGELPLEIQVKLLRVLQEREFWPLGSQHSVQTDSVVIAITNVDLEERVNQGTFREDLYYRLSQFPLEVCPLRERPEDVPLLARYYLKHYFPARSLRFSAESMAALWNYDWPGNVRQLENVVNRSATYLENATVICLNKIDDKEIKQIVSVYQNTPEKNMRVYTRQIGSYIDPPENDDDGCVGWALFSHETYDVDEDPKEDWTSITRTAFQKLRARSIKVDSYCSVGCGAALDAVMAVNTWDCQRVTLVDINEAVLPLAQENVYMNARLPVEVNVMECGFFDKFEEQKFDLIYENLPNLPWNKKEEPRGRELATFYAAQRNGASSAEKWLLSTHETFLERAKHYLEPVGLVVCCIGARAPWKSIEEMFQLQGYNAELIHFGIKKQQQADEVIAGYAKAEHANDPFTFLDLNATRDLIRQTKALKHPEELRKLVMESAEFNKVRMTAQKALLKNKKGQREAVIGHGVYVVAGRLRQETQNG